MVYSKRDKHRGEKAAAALNIDGERQCNEGASMQLKGRKCSRNEILMWGVL